MNLWLRHNQLRFFSQQGTQPHLDNSLPASNTQLTLIDVGLADLSRSRNPENPASIDGISKDGNARPGKIALLLGYFCDSRKFVSTYPSHSVDMEDSTTQGQLCSS